MIVVYAYAFQAVQEKAAIALIQNNVTRDNFRKRLTLNQDQFSGPQRGQHAAARHLETAGTMRTQGLYDQGKLSVRCVNFLAVIVHRVDGTAATNSLD